MEEHEVQTVIVTDVEEYNGEEVSFEAIYEYCSLSDEYLETEDTLEEQSSNERCI